MESIEKYFDIAFSAPDGFKKLREMILNLAIQGKLVVQDPKDKPASDLLKEINLEKEKLLNSGVLKKQKSSTPISNKEIPFQIPENWKWVRLIDLGLWAIGSGLPHAIQGQSSDDVLLCKVSDMNLPGNEKYILHTNNSLSFNDAAKNKLSISDKGTVIFPKIGGAIATNKRRVLTRPTVIDNNCLGIKPWTQLNEEWFFLLLSSFDFSKYQSGTSVPAISQTVIGEILVSLPPQNEQKRIVEKINKLMDFCDELEKLKSHKEQKRLDVHKGAINALFKASGEKDFNSAWMFIEKNFSELYSVKQNVTELRKTILQLAVMGKLVPQDLKDESASELLKEIQVEKDKLILEKKIKKDKPLAIIDENKVPFEIPKKWCWSRLGEICFKITDGFHNTPKRLSEGFPYVFATHVKEGRIDWDSVEKVGKKDHDELYFKAFPKRGEILIVNIGAGSGDAAIIDKEEPFSFKNIAILKFNQELVFNEYLLFFLFSVREKNYREITNGGCQPFLSLGILKDMPFPLPPRNEQVRIAKKIRSLMASCDELEHRIDAQLKAKTDLMNAVVVQV